MKKITPLFDQLLEMYFSLNAQPEIHILNRLEKLADRFSTTIRLHDLVGIGIAPV